MLVAAIVAYLAIRHYGEALPKPPASGVAVRTAGEGHASPLAHVLLALAVICFASRLVGGLVRRFLNQPPVIGETIAGLMLGPSLLGAVWPAGSAFLLPPEIVPLLGVLAKIGVVLFMFLVGLELDPKLLRGNSQVTLAISHASIVTPFVLGSLLAFFLYTSYSSAEVPFTVFSLFLGISLSVTAFPVLARILTDRNAVHTPLGATALACAAVDDVTAWSLLAIIVGIAGSHVGEAAWTLLWVAAYIAAMLLVVRPFILWLIAREEKLDGPPRRSALAGTFVLLLLSAFATEAIGIHALFGAFFFGALMPHEARLSEQLRASLGDIVVVLLLPVFFAFTGMRTQVGLMSELSDWLVCLAIIAVATLGKFGGSVAAGRFVGLSWRDASALGLLMNTRGLMELIVLNLGLDLGVITPKVFTMMVLMALVTTFMAVPLLDLLLGRGGFQGATMRTRGLPLGTPPQPHETHAK
jgi:Kef-type K+ transport system membrane component KefB